MRRKDREITDIHKIEKILSSAKYLHLGILDDEYPYVVPRESKNPPECSG